MELHLRIKSWQVPLRDLLPQILVIVCLFLSGQSRALLLIPVHAARPYLLILIPGRWTERCMSRFCSTLDLLTLLRAVHTAFGHL